MSFLSRFCGLLPCLLTGVLSMVHAAEVLVEAESFADKGGWVVDAQLYDVMGSPYMLAHGLGQPVTDAVTTVTMPSAGDWRVWVRTRDWTPDYEGEKPGRFRVVLDGAPTPELGVEPAHWGWVDGGVVTLADTSLEIRLQDLTGFDGRCDAILLTDDLSAAPPADGGEVLATWRKARHGETSVPGNSGTYDFVVVGGGLAGTAAAIAAAEREMHVALIQDRPVLGGNASDEVRVSSGGERRHWIVSGISNDGSNRDDATFYDNRRMDLVTSYTNIHLFTGWRAYGVETNASRELVAVDARNVESGARRRFHAPLFADCTGDGWIAYWTGAELHMGREAESEYGESLAPDTADAMTMGHSLQWTSKDTGAPSTFPEVPWALTVAGTASATGGDWNWEYGMHLDTIEDREEIRDYLLRAIYGNFYNAKQNASNADRALDWVPYVCGPRESRRFFGDYRLTENDVRNGVYFEDAVGTATWTIDLHYPKATVYRSRAEHVGVPKWYFPYRCLYSRDIPNLFLAGRNISVTHVGLGSPRVMNTCGQMGVAVGYAASLCHNYACLPRAIYQSAAKTTELQMLIGGVWPERIWVEPMLPGKTVIVDNSDVPPVDIAGNWTTSTSATGEFEGDDYFHDGNTGKGADKWIRYVPDLPEAALYEVYQKWSASANRASNAGIEIVHADGTNTVTVDMQQNGGEWNLLGTWRFAAGTNGSARILTEGSDSYVIADAFKFVEQSYAVVDNPDAETSGSWTSSSHETGDFYGADYLHSGQAESEDLWVLYRPNLNGTGVYRLQQMWNGGSSRASSARVEIASSDGVMTNSVDMTQNPGVWNTIGHHRFESGTNGYARLLTAGSGGDYVIADALRWVETDDVMIYRSDPSGVEVTSSNVIYSADVTVEDDHEVYLLWNNTDPGATNVPVEVVLPNRTQVVNVDLSQDAGEWNLLGDWQFSTGSVASVRVPTGLVDAVWFHHRIGPAEGDWDGNGLPDDWERLHFLKAGGTDPDADADLDGLCNSGEYISGTDPNDAASTFCIRDMVDNASAEPPATRIRIAWPSLEGRAYDILRSETVGGPYVPVLTDIAAIPPVNEQLLNTPGKTGFFRVVVRVAQ